MRNRAVILVALVVLAACGGSTPTLPAARARFVWVLEHRVVAHGGSISTSIAGFSVDPASGGLTLLDGSPFDLGVIFSTLIVHPSRRFLYLNGGVVEGVAIDPSTGRSLGPVLGAPLAPNYGEPLILSPDGQSLYLGGEGTVGLHVDPNTGALTPMPGSPFGHSVTFGPDWFSPNAMPFAPSGRVLYGAGILGLFDNSIGFL